LNIPAGKKEKKEEKNLLFQLWAYGFREQHSIFVNYALKRRYYMDICFFLDRIALFAKSALG
jgi:hypothetical protein